MGLEEKSEWVKDYNYRLTDSINSCELCTYGDPIDIDGQPGVESLYCRAGAEDTGRICEVDFRGICDLFVSDLFDDRED